SILPVTLRAYPVSTLFPYTTLFRSDTDVRFSGDDWRDEPGDVGAFVLSVGIGVDDDVRAGGESRVDSAAEGGGESPVAAMAHDVDRKSTRLNSSHVKISYAVFCLKK